jgi:hypothetical protein
MDTSPGSFVYSSRAAHSDARGDTMLTRLLTLAGSLLLSAVIIFAADSARSQPIDCCTQTEDYNPVWPDHGWYLCISKTVPAAYQCTNCSTAVNCKWIHFSNTSFKMSVTQPPTMVEWCCYKKFKLRIYKDANSSSFVLCHVSNSWDCKQECNNSWTIQDVTSGLPGTTLTEGNCNSWNSDTYRDIEIYPTDDLDCDDGCSINAMNHFLATICGASDIRISFDGDFDCESCPSVTPFSCDPITYDDDEITSDPCPDIEDPCI